MIEFVRLSSKITAPKLATPGSAGYDLQASLEEPKTLKPFETILVPTGLCIHIKKESFAAFLFPRSGLGHKHGLILGNGTGVIDSDYQGEIKVSLWNRSQTPYTIQPLERIAQMILMPVFHPTWSEVSEFSKESERGSGGFGHSGTH